MGKTKSHLINKNKILYGADIESFQITGSNEGKDKHFNYKFGLIARDDFTKVKYKKFKLESQDICKFGLMEFTDIYDNEEALPDYQNEKSVVAEELNLKGFTLKEVRQDNWSSGPRIVNYILTDGKCECYVDKLYHYDYSKPSETEVKYRVTERIHCKQTKRNNKSG